MRLVKPAILVAGIVGSVFLAGIILCVVVISSDLGDVSVDEEDDTEEAPHGI